MPTTGNVPGLAASSISTRVPIGWNWASQPSVVVLSLVLEQCAAWPRYVLEPSEKMKLPVHWAPSVRVWTPGRTSADAVAAMESEASNAAPRTVSERFT